MAKNFFDVDNYSGVRGDTSSNVVMFKDVILNGESLQSTLEVIKARLYILTPDKTLMEKHVMLKDAYEKYKMIEALCK